ncbi:MAG: hypothetical protein Q9214_008127, partial [Letrouitia sp. 1 TL-2023]
YLPANSFPEKARVCILYASSNTANVEQKLSLLSACGTTPFPSTVTMFTLAFVLRPQR